MKMNYFYNQIFAGFKAIRKRIRTLALAVTLALGMMPLSAFAADTIVSDYDELQAATSGTGIGEVVKLGKAISGATQLTIDRTLTLDLNGYSLTIAVDSDIYSAGIGIATGVTLTIIDSNPGSNKLTVSGGSSGAGIGSSRGTLIIERGTVEATGGRRGSKPRPGTSPGPPDHH